MGLKKTWPPGQGLFQRWVFASQHPSDQGLHWCNFLNSGNCTQQTFLARFFSGCGLRLWILVIESPQVDFKISNKEDAGAAKGEPLGANKIQTPWECKWISSRNNILFRTEPSLFLYQYISIWYHLAGTTNWGFWGGCLRIVAWQWRTLHMGIQGVWFLYFCVLYDCSEDF